MMWNRGTAGLLVAFAACGQAPEPAPPVTLPTMEVEAVEVGAGDGAAATLVGRVQSRRRTTLSTRLMARVDEVLVEVGAQVQAGDVVLRLDRRDLQSRSRALRAQLAAHESALSYSARQHGRHSGLAEAGVLAGTVAEGTELGAAQAEAARDAARAAVAGVQVLLGDATIRAPHAGRISARMAEPGQVVGPGQPLLMLEGEGLEVVFRGDSEVALEVGSSIEVLRRGEVAEVGISAVVPAPMGPGRQGRALLPAALGWAVGDVVQVRLGSGSGRGALRLPAAALLHRGGMKGVFVVQDGAAQLRWVVAADAGEGSVELLSGLRLGERVVVGDAVARLADGQPVTEPQR